MSDQAVFRVAFKSELQLVVYVLLCPLGCYDDITAANVLPAALAS
jgi:hypothetical protein